MPRPTGGQLPATTSPQPQAQRYKKQGEYKEEVRCECQGLIPYPTFIPHLSHKNVGYGAPGWDIVGNVGYSLADLSSQKNKVGYSCRTIRGKKGVNLVHFFLIHSSRQGSISIYSAYLSLNLSLAVDLDRRDR